MILLISTCTDRLSYLEFVEPIEKILNKYGIECSIKDFRHILTEDIAKADKIIISGTALRDFEYLDVSNFDWLKDCNKAVLGICAGAQVIAKTFGSDLENEELIGRHKVVLSEKNILIDKPEFGSYFMASKVPTTNMNFKILARTKDIAVMFKHRDKTIYGCLFHPEVLNQDMIVNFCRK